MRYRFYSREERDTRRERDIEKRGKEVTRNTVVTRRPAGRQISFDVYKVKWGYAAASVMTDLA